MNPQAFSACVEADSPCRGALRIAQSTPSQLRGCSGLLARSRVILAAAIAVLLFSSEAPSAFAGDDHNPIGVSGVFEGMITTGCAYNVLSHNARREIDDIVVPGSIGKYPLKMTRYYNSRSTTVSGLMGAGWTHGYQYRAGRQVLAVYILPSRRTTGVNPGRRIRWCSRAPTDRLRRLPLCFETHRWQHRHDGGVPDLGRLQRWAACLLHLSGG